MVSLAVVYVFAVAALVLEVDGVWWRAAAGIGLAVTAVLVFIAVWVHARDSYDHVEQPVARD